jgi:outer membrane protein assembly factor BamB
MSNHKTWRFAGAFILALTGSVASILAEDWPQWMGPGRDGLWNEKQVIQQFPAAGPKVKWRVPVMLGYAGPAVMKDRVVVFDYVKTEGKIENSPGGRTKLNGQERILCLDAATGKQLWKHEYACPYHISYAAGPRCTPTIAGDKVYTLGAEGKLTCLALATGDVIWSRELKQDYKTESPIWGFASHPLVAGDLLYCVVGGPGSVAVAFDKNTGKEKWKSLTASEPGYAPASLIEVKGQSQLLIWDADKLNALEPLTGKVIWSHPLKPSYSMSIMAPRKSGDLLFASGIGHVGQLLKLSADQPGVEIVWRGDTKSALYAANATPIIDGSTMYGADCESGALIAVKLADGIRLWSTFEATTGKRRASHGTAYLVKNTHNGLYYIFSDTGNLIIAKLTPEKYEEISRFPLLAPTNESFGRDVVWSHPAFANRACYARNDKEIVCVDLAE